MAEKNVRERFLRLSAGEEGKSSRVAGSHFSLSLLSFNNFIFQPSALFLLSWLHGFGDIRPIDRNCFRAKKYFLKKKRSSHVSITDELDVIFFKKCVGKSHTCFPPPSSLFPFLSTPRSGANDVLFPPLPSRQRGKSNKASGKGGGESLSPAAVTQQPNRLDPPPPPPRAVFLQLLRQNAGGQNRLFKTIQ